GRRGKPASPPAWIKPQLAALVNKAPDGSDWLHEIKFDGYRMHARLVSGRAQILTRQGNDWTNKYPAILARSYGLPVRVLSRLFRRLFLGKLLAAHQAGRLAFFGDNAALAEPRAFADFLAPLRRTKWVVYAKKPFGGPQAVL